MVQKQVSSEPYQNVQLARMFLLGTTCNDSLKFPFQKKNYVFLFVHFYPELILLNLKKKPVRFKGHVSDKTYCDFL